MVRSLVFVKELVKVLAAAVGCREAAGTKGASEAREIGLSWRGHGAERRTGGRVSEGREDGETKKKLLPVCPGLCGWVCSNWWCSLFCRDVGCWRLAWRRRPSSRVCKPEMIGIVINMHEKQSNRELVPFRNNRIKQWKYWIVIALFPRENLMFPLFLTRSVIETLNADIHSPRCAFLSIINDSIRPVHRQMHLRTSKTISVNTQTQPVYFGTSVRTSA